MPRVKTIGNRIAPARFLIFLALLAAGWSIGMARFGFERGLLGGFDLASGIYLASCVPLFRLETKGLRQAAADNDANRWMLLAISFLLTIVIFGAITVMLAHGKSLEPFDKGLIAMSLVMVWTFGNAIYTLHYAHLYYSTDDGGKDSSGLCFPGGNAPDLSDFSYFSFTIGVALQTSDVTIENRHMRRIVTVHCVAAFFFNLGVLALTINILGSS